MNLHPLPVSGQPPLRHNHARYDGDGKRVQKSNGRLYWYGMGSDPLTETDLAGTPNAEFIFFSGKRAARLDLPSAAVHYYFSDHLGSARLVTDANGTMSPCPTNPSLITGEDESDFYPFGGERQLCNRVPQNYKFTGKERDLESSLDYFGARYYASSFGRFTSADPKPIPKKFLANPQDLNLYAYVLNNPLANVDPDGQDWKKALSQLFRTTHVRFSIGLGLAKKAEVLGTGGSASAQVKATLDASVSQGAKVTTSAEAGVTGKILGAEVGPMASKPLTTLTVDSSGRATGELGGPLEASLAKLPSGTSSSTNGKTSELTIAGFEENVVVPVPTPVGVVPVPTPLTTGVSISVESNGLWNAAVEFLKAAVELLFREDREEEKNKDKEKEKKEKP